MNIRTLLCIFVCSTILAFSALSQPPKALPHIKVSEREMEYAWINSLPDSKAIDSLTKLYNDTNQYKRSFVIGLLRRFDRKNADPLLKKALNDTSSEVRSSAIRVLDEWHDTSDVSLLLNALNDKESKVWCLAANELRRFADPRAVTPLLELLDKKEPSEYSPIIYDLLPYNDNRIVPKLIEKLRDNNSGVRLNTIITLGLKRDTIAVPALIESLHDTIKELVLEAIHALSEMNDSRAIQPLVDLLFLPDISIRYITIDVIMDLPDDDRLQRFLELSKKSGYAHDGALQGIAECGGKEADSIFSRAMKKKNFPEIAAGYRYFIRKGDTSAISMLTDVLLKHGNIIMANEYARSGCKQLKSTADKWSKLMGFELKRQDLLEEGPVIWGHPRNSEPKSTFYTHRYLYF